MADADAQGWRVNLENRKQAALAACLETGT